LHMDEVLRAIDELPKNYQMVLHLRFIEDFTLKETAEAMGKKPYFCKSNAAVSKESII